jgi:hypothetical protein
VFAGSKRPACPDLLRDCQIDKEVRGREKPSDHVPVRVDLDARGQSNFLENLQRRTLF